jgi:hypothetical protein
MEGNKKWSTYYLAPTFKAAMMAAACCSIEQGKE